jgi:2-amino-4-hydroxy-6-hydroxymethyldihydropteridine diphosphokinase
MAISPVNHAPRLVAFIGLGSNLERPFRQISRALASLHAVKEVNVVVASSFYETAPVGKLDQPNFINAVVQIETTLSPTVLLAQMLKIEAKHARVRITKNGPRTLDLDLLLYNGVAMHAESLTVPHPRMHTRAFVLVPLVEIAPSVVIPGQGTAAAHLDKLDTSGVKVAPDDRQSDRRAKKPRRAEPTTAPR